MVRVCNKKKRSLLPFIHLYNDGAISTLDIDSIAQYLREKTDVMIDIRETLLSNGNNLMAVAEEFAKAKITNPCLEEINPHPLLAEIEYEYKILLAKKPSKLFYDGFCLQEILRKLIPGDEHNLFHVHIIFISRLFGTYADNRYHLRVAIFGSPSIISIAGLIEAPAKPREFYLRKQMGEDVTLLKKEFMGRFIDYDDCRITEVIKGYVMQAFFYHIFGEPFCDSLRCRLFNAHWQEEVIQAQLNNADEFCEKHKRLLAKISAGGNL